MSAPPAPDPAAEDFYDRLGVARDAAPEAVRAAYRDAVRRHPPERDAEAFKRVREAFETLDDPAARQGYDLLHTDESAAGLMARAERAMGDRQYGEAASLFKRVLLDDPDAARARNLLGLCFMYQGSPDAAVAQYERLLARPGAATVWLLNAGHAYREAKRPDDARRVLHEAAARPDADAADVGVALADVEVDARDYKAAHEAIRAALAREAAGTPGRAMLLVRRLDVHLLAHEKSAYEATAAAVEQAAAAAGWQQQGAYRLGIVAWKLIDAGAFALARPAADAARRLQPDDLDYDALVETAAALGANDIARARHLVRTHVAFGAGKWLHPLGARVLAYCDAHAAYDGMRPIERPPTLTLVNGVGPRLVGRHGADAKTGSYVSTLYFTVFLIPVLPLRRYRVRDGEKRGWHFLGELPLTPRERLHRNIGVVLAGLLAFWIAVQAVARSHPRAGGDAPAAAPARGAPDVDAPAPAPTPTPYRGAPDSAADTTREPPRFAPTAALAREGAAPRRSDHRTSFGR